MVNVGLPSRSGGDKFRDAVTDYWMPALDAFRPELIYISAGFDAHREDDMGNLGPGRGRLRMGHPTTHAGGQTATAKAASCRVWRAATC
jgi:acetoin utilization deacetylase AcuC-like enzyme